MSERQLPLFAGTDLAERIENAERTMISEATEAAARRNPSAGAFATPLSGGVAAWASPGSPL
ncbi:MAG: GNAT family N-acetyltransferase, partial [Thermoanaerobaculia bacterium]